MNTATNISGNTGISSRNEEISRSSYAFKPRNGDLAEMKKQNRRRKNKIRLYCLLILFCAILVFAAVCFSKIFVISEITVQNCTAYSSEEVIDSSALFAGENIYSFKRDNVKALLCKNLPYIKDVKIRRELPDRLNLTVTEETPSTYISLSGNYYIISDDLKVLKKENDKEKLELMKLMHVYASNIESCIVGEKLKFRDEAFGQILEEIIYNLKKADLIMLCDELDITNKFDIKFEYRARFTVLLGDGFDTDMKIEFMKAIADKMYETDKGVIDVSDNNLREASVIRK